MTDVSPRSGARRMLAALLGGALVTATAGCVRLELSENGADPYGVDGKADALSFFDDALSGVEVELPRDGHGSVYVTGRGHRTRYRASDIERWGPEAAVLRVTLGDSATLAGMRSFLLRPAAALEDRGPLELARVASAVGVVAPRGRIVGLLSGEQALGSYVLLEHVGDRFLDQRLGEHGGRVLRRADEAPDQALLEERLARAHELVGGYAVGSVLDGDSAARLVAAADALGRTAVPLALYVREDGTMVAIPEEASTAVALETLRDAVLAVHPLRQVYRAALEAAARCLEEPDCGLGTQSDAARATLALEALDAPDGDLAYPPFARRGGETIARFRHRVPALFARSVTLRLQPSEGSSRLVPLAYESATDTWSASWSWPLGPSRYDYLVTDAEGASHPVSDAVSALDGDRLARLDPASLDVLVAADIVTLEVREPSGIAVHEGRFFVMGDESHHVVEIDPRSGATLDRVDLRRTGIEDLAVDPLSGELVAVDEDAALVARFTAEGAPVSQMAQAWARDARGGLEGLAIRPTDGHILLAKERGPAMIAELDRRGEVVSRAEVSFAPDLSALAWSEDDGALYALSDEARTVYRLSPTLEVTGAWEIDVEKPEGLAIHEGRLYVVGDADASLHVFELNRGRHEDTTRP